MVGGFLGLSEDQMQRIYKNFARWRRIGWFQAIEEAGLTTIEIQELLEIQANQPQLFHQQIQEILAKLLPFYRKSEPPHYPCLGIPNWEELVSEGYGLDYRMWHLPFCFKCVNVVAKICAPDVFFNVPFKVQILPFPHNEDELSSRRFQNLIALHSHRTKKRSLLSPQAV